MKKITNDKIKNEILKFDEKISITPEEFRAWLSGYFHNNKQKDNSIVITMEQMNDILVNAMKIKSELNINPVIPSNPGYQPFINPRSWEPYVGTPIPRPFDVWYSTSTSDNTKDN